MNSGSWWPTLRRRTSSWASTWVSWPSAPDSFMSAGGGGSSPLLWASPVIMNYSTDNQKYSPFYVSLILAPLRISSSFQFSSYLFLPSTTRFFPSLLSSLQILLVEGIMSWALWEPHKRAFIIPKRIHFLNWHLTFNISKQQTVRLCQSHLGQTIPGMYFRVCTGLAVGGSSCPAWTDIQLKSVLVYFHKQINIDRQCGLVQEFAQTIDQMIVET